MLSTVRGSIASRKHLDRKTKDIKEMQEYKLTDADITAMIAKKKSLTRIPKNLVHEKTRLKQLLLTAMSNGNESEVENVQDQLAQLEELAQGNRDKSISRESEMFRKVNERNRKMNMVEMREAERREAEERKKNGICSRLSCY
jgi:RNA polymerase-associated protein RTF1